MSSAIAAKLEKVDFSLVYRELGVNFSDPSQSAAFKRDHRGWQVPITLVPCNRIVLALRDRLVPVDVFVGNIGSRTDIRDAANGDYLFGCGATVEPQHRMLDVKKSMSLLEYLVVLYGCHIATGEVLGVEKVTLLNGSRFVDADNVQTDGTVPTIQVLNGRVQIGTSRPDDRAFQLALKERQIDFHQML